MTWTTFIDQYQATGRQKAEGYFPAHFDGMSEEERARARAMLEERADTTDLDGLRLIGDRGTVARLEALAPEDGKRGVPFAVNRCETLSVLTDDGGKLEPLIDLLDVREDSDAALAAQAIARHPLPRTFARPLASRIGDGRHEVSLIWLAKAWLSTQGVKIWEPAQFDAYVPFIRELSRARPSARAALLAAEAERLG